MIPRRWVQKGANPAFGRPDVSWAHFRRPWALGSVQCATGWAWFLAPFRFGSSRWLEPWAEVSLPARGRGIGQSDEQVAGVSG